MYHTYTMYHSMYYCTVTRASFTRNSLSIMSPTIIPRAFTRSFKEEDRQPRNQFSDSKRTFKRFSPLSPDNPCYHGRRQRTGRSRCGATLYELEDLLFIRPRNCSKIYVNEGKNECKRIPPPPSLSFPLSRCPRALLHPPLPLSSSSLHGLSERQTLKNGTDPRYVRARE